MLGCTSNCRSPRCKTFRIAPTAVYLSSRSARRNELLVIAEECRQAGFKVASKWLWAAPADVGDPVAAAAAAQKDLDGLREADLFVGFTESVATNPAGRGGRHLELGVALALGQRVVLVGPEPEHVFHSLPEIERYRDWAEARSAVLGSGG